MNQETTTEDVSVAPVVEEHVNPVEDKAADADKASKALLRRIDRLTREKYELRAENDHLRKPVQSDESPTEDLETKVETRAREMLELKQFNDHCNAVFDKGSKASASFKESFKTLSDEIGQPFDARGKPSAVMTAILDADEPHKLIIHLADNPELAAEIADLSPTRQIRRLAQIEKEMDETANPKQSNAPKPVQPVKGSVSSDAEPDPKDTKRWIEWENQKLIAARRK